MSLRRWSGSMELYYRNHNSCESKEKSKEADDDFECGEGGLGFRWRGLDRVRCIVHRRTPVKGRMRYLGTESGLTPEAGRRSEN